MDRLVLFSTILQFILFSFLLVKDRNDGEKEIFKKQSWRSSDVLIIILASNLLFYIFLFYRGKYFYLDQLVLDNPYIFHLYNLIVIVMYFRLKLKESVFILGFKRFNMINLVGAGIFIGMVCYGIGALMVALNLLSWGDNMSLETWQKIFNKPWRYITYFLGFIIFAPIAEECLYRGILYSPYRKKYGPKMAIIFTSLFFTVSHLGSGLFQILILGIFLATIYEKKESIIPNITAHIAYNILVYVSRIYYMNLILMPR